MNQFLIAVAAVLAAVVPFLRSYLAGKFGAQRLATAHQLAGVAVTAAERIAVSNPALKGADKYTIAAKFLADAGKRVGVKLTADEITGFVNSALAELEASQGIVKTAVVPAPTV